MLTRPWLNKLFYTCVKKILSFLGRKTFLTTFFLPQNYFPLSVQQLWIGRSFSECKSPENNNKNIVLVKKGGERSDLESLALTSWICLIMLEQPCLGTKLISFVSTRKGPMGCFADSTLKFNLLHFNWCLSSVLYPVVFPVSGSSQLKVQTPQTELWLWHPDNRLCFIFEIWSLHTLF